MERGASIAAVAFEQLDTEADIPVERLSPLRRTQRQLPQGDIAWLDSQRARRGGESELGLVQGFEMKPGGLGQRANLVDAVRGRCRQGLESENLLPGVASKDVDRQQRPRRTFDR